MLRSCFFFTDTATSEIYTLSLHDALPILMRVEHPVITDEELARLENIALPDFRARKLSCLFKASERGAGLRSALEDRKSTRLNSSHSQISYAVFCLNKKNILRASGAVAVS